MAYDPNGLINMGPRGAVGQGAGSVRSAWAYTIPDAAAVVEAASYFNAAASGFAKGDSIDAVMAVNGTPIRKNYVVTSATGAATVVIALQTTTAG